MTGKDSTAPPHIRPPVLHLSGGCEPRIGGGTAHDGVEPPFLVGETRIFRGRAPTSNTIGVRMVYSAATDDRGPGRILGDASATAHS